MDERGGVDLAGGVAAGQPERIADEAELEERLSEPTPGVIEAMQRLEGDLVLLGMGGKMGRSIGRMAARADAAAGRSRRIVGVARRWSEADAARLAEEGIETACCDLLDPDAVAGLPPAGNVIFLAGRKFGTAGEEALTWASNTLLPGYCARRYRESRIVAFSTGCVYPFVLPASGGCDESTPPAPLGDYAQSSLGRERVFDYFSRTAETAVCLFRLNYAIDLRYGVLHDIAMQVWNEEPVDLTMAFFNCIWQADANAHALQALELAAAPAQILNSTGPQILRTRDAALAFGKHFGKPVRFTGTESETAFLSDASRALGLYGPPRVDPATLVAWTADWIARGGASLGKPTHFQTKTGDF